MYIGERGRSAKQRMTEHKTAVNNKEEKVHIYKHTRATKGHNFNFDPLETIEIESFKRPRRIVEAIHTKFTEETSHCFADYSILYYSYKFKSFN